LGGCNNLPAAKTIVDNPSTLVSPGLLTSRKNRPIISSAEIVFILVGALGYALGDCGSIIVYHQQFESQRLSELASWLPEFSKRIDKIQSRLWDLLPIVRNHVYHPAFGGSYSLKWVLPALVPEMTYEGMEVADGQAAGLAWDSLVRGGLDREEPDGIRKALLDYCGQDTLALVRLLEILRLAAAG
jgi:hypothetical protein